MPVLTNFDPFGRKIGLTCLRLGNASECQQLSKEEKRALGNKIR
jgi:hypothetical protein